MLPTDLPCVGSCKVANYCEARVFARKAAAVSEQTGAEVEAQRIVDDAGGEFAAQKINEAYISHQATLRIRYPEGSYELKQALDAIEELYTEIQVNILKNSISRDEYVNWFISLNTRDIADMQIIESFLHRIRVGECKGQTTNRNWFRKATNVCGLQSAPEYQIIVGMQARDRAELQKAKEDGII